MDIRYCITARTVSGRTRISPTRGLSRVRFSRSARARTLRSRSGRKGPSHGAALRSVARFPKRAERKGSPDESLEAGSRRGVVRGVRARLGARSRRQPGCRRVRCARASSLGARDNARGARRFDRRGARCRRKGPGRGRGVAGRCAGAGDACVAAVSVGPTSTRVVAATNARRGSIATVLRTLAETRRERGLRRDDATLRRAACPALPTEKSAARLQWPRRRRGTMQLRSSGCDRDVRPGRAPPCMARAPLWAGANRPAAARRRTTGGSAAA